MQKVSENLPKSAIDGKAPQSPEARKTAGFRMPRDTPEFGWGAGVPAVKLISIGGHLDSTTRPGSVDREIPACRLTAPSGGTSRISDQGRGAVAVTRRGSFQRAGGVRITFAGSSPYGGE
jgi:hypothetical protein